MNCIRFVDGTPITGISLLDEIIRTNGFSFHDNKKTIEVDFIYNNEKYVAFLWLNFIYISTVNVNGGRYIIGYNDEEFYRFINKGRVITFHIDIFEVICVMKHQFYTITINDNKNPQSELKFRSKVNMDMPFHEFAHKLENVLTLLLDSYTKYDLEHASNLVFAYEAAMTCQMKRA